MNPKIVLSRNIRSVSEFVQLNENNGTSFKDLLKIDKKIDLTCSDLDDHETLTLPIEVEVSYSFRSEREPVYNKGEYLQVYGEALEEAGIMGNEAHVDMNDYLQACAIALENSQPLEIIDKKDVLSVRMYGREIDNSRGGKYVITINILVCVDLATRNLLEKIFKRKEIKEDQLDVKFISTSSLLKPREFKISIDKISNVPCTYVREIDNLQLLYFHNLDDLINFHTDKFTGFKEKFANLISVERNYFNGEVSSVLSFVVPQLANEDQKLRYDRMVRDSFDYNFKGYYYTDHSSVHLLCIYPIAEIGTKIKNVVE